MQYQREIFDGIRRILRSLRESSRSAETQLGISGAQLLVLQLLKPGKPLSINDLAERTQTHQSSVSAVVARLADAELVKREVSSSDGRRVEIGLTGAGGRILKKKVPRQAREDLLDAISNLSLKKQKQLAELLTEVVEAAGFDTQPASLFFEDDKGKNK